jgi:hypothetical protein
MKQGAEIKQGQEEEEKRQPRRWRVLVTSLVALSSAIIVTIVGDYLYINQPLVTTGSIAIDKAESRQGPGSVAWHFTLQSPRRFSLMPSETVGGFVHFEVRANQSGSIHGLDWRNYNAVEFFAKASVAVLPVTTVNLFVGSDFEQYTFQGDRHLVLGTTWREYTVPLSRFALAPWETKTRKNRVPDLNDVTAFGLDEKTSTALSGLIWVDYFRLANRNGKKTVLSNCDHLSFHFEGHKLRWIVGVRNYG